MDRRPAARACAWGRWGAAADVPGRTPPALPCPKYLFGTRHRPGPPGRGVPRAARTLTWVSALGSTPPRRRALTPAHLFPVAVGLGGLVVLHKVVVHEAQRERRLADTAGADHDDLVERQLLCLLQRGASARSGPTVPVRVSIARAACAGAVCGSRRERAHAPVSCPWLAVLGGGRRRRRGARARRIDATHRTAGHYTARVSRRSLRLPSVVRRSCRASRLGAPSGGRCVRVRRARVRPNCGAVAFFFSCCRRASMRRDARAPPSVPRCCCGCGVRGCGVQGVQARKGARQGATRGRQVAHTHSERRRNIARDVTRRFC